MTTVRPELLAAKIRAAYDGEADAACFADQLINQPRILELLWFVQKLPGGLERFSSRLIESFPDRFQSKAMTQAGTPAKTDKYSLAQCLIVWQEDSRAENDSRFLDSDGLERPHHSALGSLDYRDWLALFIGPETTVKDAVGNELQAKALRAGVARFNFPFLKQRCLDEAKRVLPNYLLDCCHKRSYTLDGFSWCPELVKTLFDFMDRHAAETAGELAQTEIAKVVFRELEFAYSQKVAVPIVGESRFGKTKAVSVWCGMRPGRARLVTVPDSNRERDFFTAHADALGLAYTHATSASQLRDAVEFIHRASGLFLVYDEAHFLIPASYHKATPPRRLNWVRCQVIDRELGCAFFATPQSYRETLSAYVKKTGYRMEQWLGRMAPTVILPESLPAADVIAVARKHFPEIPEPYLKLISARAMQSEGYLKNMELCVKRARFLAIERGRVTANKDDVLEAIEQMMPSTARTSAETDRPRRRSAGVLQPDRTDAAETLQADVKHQFSRRQSSPLTDEREPVLTG